MTKKRSHMKNMFRIWLTVALLLFVIAAMTPFGISDTFADPAQKDGAQALAGKGQARDAEDGVPYEDGTEAGESDESGAGGTEAGESDESGAGGTEAGGSDESGAGGTERAEAAEAMKTVPACRRRPDTRRRAKEAKTAKSARFPQSRNQGRSVPAVLTRMTGTAPCTTGLIAIAGIPAGRMGRPVRCTRSRFIRGSRT
ncbi:MAG: hypothetical protein FWG03_09425 [Clostridiales bacterium]|nr:hypothetical protein [Clostridiales bacterium]